MQLQNWANESNQVCCKVSESKVYHNEIIYIEIQKGLDSHTWKIDLWSFFRWINNIVSKPLRCGDDIKYIFITHLK